MGLCVSMSSSKKDSAEAKSWLTNYVGSHFVLKENKERAVGCR